MSYKTRAIDIVRDWSASDWIKKQIIELHKRDVVDVLNDLAVLTDLFKLRLEEFKDMQLQYGNQS